MESAADVLQGRLLRYLAGFDMIKEVREDQWAGGDSLGNAICQSQVFQTLVVNISGLIHFHYNRVDF